VVSVHDIGHVFEFEFLPLSSTHRHPFRPVSERVSPFAGECLAKNIPTLPYHFRRTLPRRRSKREKSSHTRSNSPVAEVEPQPAAEVEVTPKPVQLARRVNPLARKVTDRYDPLAGWRRWGIRR
jgi:hypothetical protein